MAKYTFLLPAYKSEYLDKALTSILKQSYNDFEIIISDDCSPHNIQHIVNKYNDKRIIYRKNNVNIGGEKLVKHWNLLLSLCTSQYLIIAADDDIYESNFLEDVDNCATRYPDVDIIRARTRRINGNDEVIDIEGVYETFETQLDAFYNSLYSEQIWCIGNYVFKTEALKHKGGFIDFPYAWFSDLATALMMSEKGICYTHKYGFNFRLSERNISNTRRNKIIDRQKLYATISFGEWLSCFYDKIISTNEIVSTRRKAKVIHKADSLIYSHIGDHGWSIGFYELIKIYHRIKKWPSFSNFCFIKNYTLAALARRIGKYA